MNDTLSFIIPPYFVTDTPSLTVGPPPHARPPLLFSTIEASNCSSMR